MWLSAFVPTFFLQVWKPPHAKEVLPKFSTFLYNLDFYLVTHVQFLFFFQRHSGASSNHVGG
jgi:hypothetical protein